MINRGEEIAGAAGALDDVFAAFVGGADDAARLDAAAGPDIGESSRPVIATGLHGARRGAGIARAGAAVEADLRGAAKLAGDDYEDTFVQATRVDVLDEGGHAPVVS